MLSHSLSRLYSKSTPVGTSHARRSFKAPFQRVFFLCLVLVLIGLCVTGQETPPLRQAGGEANLVLPDFDQATFLDLSLIHI